MHELIWWTGALHIAVYIVGGTIFCATWTLYKALQILGLWGNVFHGLREYRRIQDSKEQRDAKKMA